MPRTVKIAFASCRPELIGPFVEKFSLIAPEQELWVVSEFPPPQGRWIPFRVDRKLSDNEARLRDALRTAQVGFAAVVLQPGAPYRGMRWLGWRTRPLHTLFYNANLDHWVLRPSSAKAIADYCLRRLREVVTFQLRPGGDVYTWAWRFRHPSQLRRPLAYRRALAAGQRAARQKRVVERPPDPEEALPDGISVVIPSRGGLDLLRRLLPLISSDASEIIVVDNGSADGTEVELRRIWPDVRVIVSSAPLPFAVAVNQGVEQVRFSHVCLLNNDMEPEPGFLPALRKAFSRVPGLFCATAQILFPAGKRREETGKAVMLAPERQEAGQSFPVYCAEPIVGEADSWVLYGSGGCSLYRTEKLRALGGFNPAFVPAYVEDLDLGFRAWQRSWPTVFVAEARTLHHHRSTTSRHYTEAQLAEVLERNYLLFLASAVSDPQLFGTLWRAAIQRMNRRAALEAHAPSRAALFAAPGIALEAKVIVQPSLDEREIFALGSGDVAVFPGRARKGAQGSVVVASCYLPFPLSHGGAVRMYNLMLRAASAWSQILVSFVDEIATPPEELLEICTEIVLVKRHGTHVKPDRGRPDVVEEFDSDAFRAAIRLAVRKWNADLVQLEFTQTAQYATACAPAATILVEHDITLDLYRQLLSVREDYDTRVQLRRWEAFERKAWGEVDCVVVMSDKDRQAVSGAKHVEVLPNGVDPVRFMPAVDRQPDRGRLLFIGSFAHLPNLLALDFFFRDVWPLLQGCRPTLHVIGGSRHEYHFQRFRDQLSFSLEQAGVEFEGFVSDVRGAYLRASVVIAPLLASAGTNIKITEAMSMGKAVVSTPGGVNGLDELIPGKDVLVESDPRAFAEAVTRLLTNETARRTLEHNARRTAQTVYAWDTIAERQDAMYRRLKAR